MDRDPRVNRGLPAQLRLNHGPGMGLGSGPVVRPVEFTSWHCVLSVAHCLKQLWALDQAELDPRSKAHQGLSCFCQQLVAHIWEQKPTTTEYTFNVNRTAYITSEQGRIQRTN